MVAYLVFLMPIVVSVPLAAYVMADILSKPDRKLDMWPFDDYDAHPNSVIDSGVASAYSASDTLEIRVLDSDCGDTYGTVIDSDDNFISQNFSFNLCMGENKPNVSADKSLESTQSVYLHTVLIPENEQPWTKHVSSLQ